MLIKILGHIGVKFQSVLIEQVCDFVSLWHLWNIITDEGSELKMYSISKQNSSMTERDGGTEIDDKQRCFLLSMRQIKIAGKSKPDVIMTGNTGQHSTKKNHIQTNVN